MGCVCACVCVGVAAVVRLSGGGVGGFTWHGWTDSHEKHEFWFVNMACWDPTTTLPLVCHTNTSGSKIRLIHPNKMKAMFGQYQSLCTPLYCTLSIFWGYLTVSDPV